MHIKNTKIKLKEKKIFYKNIKNLFNFRKNLYRLLNLLIKEDLIFNLLIFNNYFKTFKLCKILYFNKI